MKNISIYDNQGETFDRITIVFDNKKPKQKTELFIKESEQVKTEQDFYNILSA